MWSENKILDEDTPLTNTFVTSTTVDGREIELVTWDTRSLDMYESLRRLSYEGTHIVLICFDITDPDSFDNIEEMWNPEVNQYLQDVPKVLVGCKMDLRNSETALAGLRLRNLMPVSPYAADKLAIKIQALAYFETSAVKNQGLTELFDYVADAAAKLAPKRRSGAIRRVLSRGQINLKFLY
ncbi:GTP-binding protein rho3 precursor [Pyrenophora tritici-repentis]|nr:GTP-binding protein rho3 precursor [Pyrenophora tritici-repentis]